MDDEDDQHLEGDGVDPEEVGPTSQEEQEEDARCILASHAGWLRGYRCCCSYCCILCNLLLHI